MDVVRIRRRPNVARGVGIGAALVVAVGACAWAVPVLFVRHPNVGPAVSEASLVLDTVKRGVLENDVTAAGVFAPDRVFVAASAADGIVTSVPVRAGMHVNAGTTIATLANPDLAAAVVDAQAQLAAARADVEGAREEADAANLDTTSTLREARAESARADVEIHDDTPLHTQGLIADLQFRTAVIKRDEDRDLVAIAQSKVGAGNADGAAKIAAAQAHVAQLAAELDARRAQLATLTIRAGAAGVVQSVAIDPGARVTSGTEFARIADERDLKAVLQVAESDLRGVSPGLPVRITTSDAATARGHVARIAPAAQNGTVSVDVALDAVPPGSRPDQNVDGTIVVARVPHALSVARPANEVDGTPMALYRLDRDGTRAYRTQVVIASGDADRARVVRGLRAGDRVIVSDTSNFDAPVLRITP